MRGWVLTAEEIVILAVDDLALRILVDVVDNREWNSRNWMVLARQVEEYRSHPDCLQALDEAWAWLYAQGLVVRDSGQSAPEAISVSRRGREVLDRGLPWLRATARLEVQLLPEIERAARAHFLRGEFDMAVFGAMREVEIAVREAAGLPGDRIGVTLMKEAFGEGKPMWDPQMHGGEAVALMDLFKGSIGLFKNPSSHRQVDFKDPVEAAEAVILADLLLRILQRRVLLASTSG
jgi:uncharacterized protein (TIGR02391 family)